VWFALKERTNNLKTFSDFNLNPAILKTLEQEGYATPTPIQLQAIPSVLEGRDLQGIAQTGTGKTAAFALPILHRLAANKREPMRRGCRVLVLSPTRELCSQICDSFRVYGRNLGIKVAAVYGGVGHRPQIEMLARGVDVLSRPPAACSITWIVAMSRSKASRPWCSTRPTRCSIWASFSPSGASSRKSP